MNVVAKADRGPLFVTKFVEKVTQGPTMLTRVFGNMKIASGEVVCARDLNLGTIDKLYLTPASSEPSVTAYTPRSHIYHKGEYANYARVNLFDSSGKEITAPTSYAPKGSVDLSFFVLGRESIDWE